jgi:hypothetical protein
LRAASFLSDTWEKQPLVLNRASAGYYGGLFSVADLDAVVAYSRPRFLEPAAFALGPPPSDSYVQGWLPDQLLAPTDVYPGIAELRQVYAQGKTIVIRGMQQRWPAIATLCRNLEAEFHCPVHANLYLTPPGAQGFDAHFDTHEVFALQLDGRKKWRLYGAAATLPLARDKASVPRSQLGPARDVCLEPGDLLYIPRGHAHEAFTAEQRSLHLTVGVNIYRWADLIQHALVGLSRRDARFRESVPPEVLLGDGCSPATARRFQDLLQAVAGNACLDDAAQRLSDDFFDQLAALPGAGVVPRDDADRIELDTVLCKCPGAICRVRVDWDGAAISFPGGQVAGPARIAPALQFVARSEQFAVRSLPDGLGNDGKVVLARRLVRERLLAIAPAEHDRSAGDRAGRAPTTGSGAIHRAPVEGGCDR